MEQPVAAMGRQEARASILLVNGLQQIGNGTRARLGDRFKLLETTDDRAALDVLALEPVNLVLLETHVLGFERFSLLKRIVPLGVPVIVIAPEASSRVSARLAVIVTKIGAKDFLLAPFGEDRLLALIRSELQTASRAGVAPETWSPAAAAGFARPRILLIGGDVGTRAGTAVALRQTFRIETADTPGEALDRVLIRPPDLMVCEVGVDAGEKRPLLEAFRARLPACPILVTSAAPKADVLQAIAPHRVDGVLGPPVYLDRLSNAIHEVLAPRLPSLRPRHRAVDRRLSEAVLYIGRNISSGQLVVKTVADGIRIPDRSLQRYFRVVLGMKVLEFIQQVRVEVAKHFLARTRQKLETVAEQAGFCDRSHMTRVFRQHTGLSPRLYRLHSR